MEHFKGTKMTEVKNRTKTRFAPVGIAFINTRRTAGGHERPEINYTLVGKANS